MIFPLRTAFAAPHSVFFFFFPLLFVSGIFIFIYLFFHLFIYFDFLEPPHTYGDSRLGV